MDGQTAAPMNQKRRPFISAMLVSKAAHSDARVLAEARVLLRAGCEVVVLCWDREKRFTSQPGPDGVRLLDLGPKGSHGAGTGQLRHYLGFWLSGSCATADASTADFDTPARLAASSAARSSSINELHGEARPGAPASRRRSAWLERRLTRGSTSPSPIRDLRGVLPEVRAPRHEIYANWRPG
jgi:hypothetical protein